MQNYPDGTSISLINFDAELLAEVVEKYDKINVIIPLKHEEEININFNLKGIYKSFAYDGDVVSHSVNSHIRLLTKEDKLYFPEGIQANRSNLSDAFAEFVLTGKGEIFGYFDEEGNLLGYLSCCREIDNIWDVVYIYVLPQHRSHGIGTALAAQYLIAKSNQGQIPYYSGVTNPASESAALKAGFKLCGLRYYY